MYTIDQLSLMTGLTTRTLRNYLKGDILHGEKENGIWRFSEEQVQAFLEHPAVRPSIRAKHHGIVYDFLAGQNRHENEMCFLLDRAMEEREAKQIADFFCHAVAPLSHVRFAYSYESGTARYILKGAEEDIRRILQSLYAG